MLTNDPVSYRARETDPNLQYDKNTLDLTQIKNNQNNQNEI
jgi:hypothetical protein